MRLVLGGFPEIADMSDEARAAAERVRAPA
jgi:hypothetical protein